MKVTTETTVTLVMEEQEVERLVEVLSAGVSARTAPQPLRELYDQLYSALNKE